MKRYLILIFCLFAIVATAGSQIIEVPNAFAWGAFGVGGGVPAAAGDSCSASDLLFSWYMENTTVTSGTPAGCSLGDTTATANDSITLSSSQNRSSGGTNSAYVADLGKYYAFTGSSEDIFHVDAGTIQFYVYITSWGVSARFAEIYGDANNYFTMHTRNDGTPTNRDITVKWKGNNINVFAQPSATDLVLNAWCGIKFEWDISENPDWKISFDLNNDGSFTNAETGNMDPTDWGAGAKSSFELKAGETGVVETTYYIDDFKIYDTESL